MGSGMTAPPSSPTTAGTASSWVAGGRWWRVFPVLPPGTRTWACRLRGMRPNFATREVPGQRATKRHPPPARKEAPKPCGAPSSRFNADASEVSAAGMVRPDHRPRADAGPRTAPRRARWSAHAQRAAGPATLADGAVDPALRAPARTRDHPPPRARRHPPLRLLRVVAGGPREPRSRTRAPRARSSPPGTRRVPGSCGVPLGHLDPLVTDGIAGTPNVLLARPSPRREIASGLW